MRPIIHRIRGLHPATLGFDSVCRAVRSMRAFACCVALLSVLPRCGGTSTTGAEAKSAAAADDTKSSADASHDSTRDEDEEQASESSTAADDSRASSCDDGACSKCGSGICPAGWYCDEKASGGGACSWLTECAEKPTCACVTRVLGASCKCREESGGLKVACD